MYVTYYYPWNYFYPIRSGAAAVAAAHMEYFQSRGYMPRILVGGDPRRGARREFERHYHWVDDIVDIPLWQYPAIKLLRDVYTFGTCLMWHSALCEVDAVRQLLSKPTDLAFFNYIFSAPLLDHVPPNSPRVLESVDIMSRQYSAQRPAPAVFQQNLRTEFDLYRLFDAVIMINEDEESFARCRAASNATYVPRAIPLIPEHDPTEAGAAKFDLVMIGSDHRPNIEGAAWFYKRVFQPFLKLRGLRWAIAGSMCHHLTINDPAVAVLGPVQDIARLYQDSKVVIAPVFAGAGISIKTLEALGRGKPVVTTPCGRRGLLDADNALVCHEFDRDPAAVADCIIDLCASREQRERLGRRSREYISANFSAELYGRRMDRILAPLVARPQTKAA